MFSQCLELVRKQETVLRASQVLFLPNFLNNYWQFKKNHLTDNLSNFIHKILLSFSIAFVII